MQYIEDKELGRIKLQANARAKRFVARYRKGEFVLTHPTFVSAKEIKIAIEQLRPKLLETMRKAPVQFLFDEDTKFSTYSFSLQLQKSDLKNVYGSLNDGVLTVSFPRTTNWEDEETQLFIRNGIEGACRHEANRLFPTKLRELAKLHNFTVGDVKINKSRSRWGSCSSKKNINLSYFCMMLPEHLIEFIMLHELCHTIEMNHSSRFWALLDSVSNNRAKELTEELKHIKLKW